MFALPAILNQDSPPIFPSFYDETTLFLEGKGLNDSTNIVDSSLANVPISIFGNTKISTNQFKLNSSSIYFDGSGDYLTIPASPNYLPENNIFTWEAWIFPETGSGYIFNYGGNVGFTYFSFAVFLINNKIRAVFNPYNSNTEIYLNSNIFLNLNTWHHIAVSRNNDASNNLKLFINGQLDVFTSVSGDISHNIPTTCYIGCFLSSNNPTSFFKGYLNGLRFTKGISRYNSSFSLNSLNFSYISITISPISTNDILDHTERNSNLTISGTTFGDANGKTLTLNLNNTNYTTTVSNDTWSLPIPAQDVALLSAGLVTVTATMTNLGSTFTKTRTITVLNAPYSLNLLSLSPSLWLDANDSNTITLESGAVSQWSDKSGNNRHATQATAGNRPLLVADGLNSTDVIRFDGSNDFFSLASSLSNMGIRSIFVVGKKNLTNSLMMPLSNNGNSTDFCFVPWNDGYIYASGSGYFVFTSGGSINTPYISSEVFNNSFYDLWLNGTQLSNFSVVNRSNQSIFNEVGRRLGTNQYTDGDISQILIFPRVLTQAEREQVEGYLAWTTGLQGNLPSNHAYKYTPVVLA